MNFLRDSIAQVWRWFAEVIVVAVVFVILGLVGCGCLDDEVVD